MKKILEGVRVLDLTRVVAGPLCTQMMADLGATVFKIERPGIGDDSRRMAPVLQGSDYGEWNGESAVYLSYNRGKKSIAVDFTTPKGAEIVRSLARTCHVFVENFKVGSLAKANLDYEAIRQLREDIIYCSITGFGQSGPYAAYAAYDFILQGMAGPMSTCGLPDGQPGATPLRTSIPIVDIVTGIQANAAIISALFHHARTGEGQHIDLSLLDCGVALNGHLANSYLLTGMISDRVGNTNPIASPSEVVPCKNGSIILGAGNDRQFVAICEALKAPEMANDPRFSNNAQRILYRDELTAKLRSLMGPHDRDELLKELRERGVPCGPINNLEQVFLDPQVQHRELVETLRGQDNTPISLVRHPVYFSETPAHGEPPPKLGFNTSEVLSEELNFLLSSMKDLEKEGVIFLGEQNDH